MYPYHYKSQDFILNRQYMIMRMNHIFFIQSSSDEHLDWLHNLLLWIGLLRFGDCTYLFHMLFSFSLDIFLDMSYDPFLVLLRNILTLFNSDYINLCSHQYCTRVFFSPQLSLPLLPFWPLDNSYFNKNKMIPHCGFSLHFFNNYLSWAFFLHVFVVLI